MVRIYQLKWHHILEYCCEKLKSHFASLVPYGVMKQASNHLSVQQMLLPLPPPPRKWHKCRIQRVIPALFINHCQAISPDILFYIMGIRLSCQLQMRWHFALYWTIDWNQAWVTAGIDENHTDISLSLIKAAIGTSLESRTPVPYRAIQEVEILVYHFPTCISWYRIFHTGQGLLSESTGLDLVWFQIH